MDLWEGRGNVNKINREVVYNYFLMLCFDFNTKLLYSQQPMILGENSVYCFEHKSIRQLSLLSIDINYAVFILRMELASSCQRGLIM